ncbi:alkylmercury lyase [Asanoa iriomotensis]|uniref:alkylmercury lyase n=1 Tax=Asanoa iriomotensis TaxID=234613 RepID=UPI001940E21D|nr:alkylmercury lyase [Asanoa iriomotensis]
MLVELRSVPDCPNLDRVRTSLRTAMADLGLPPTVIERVGDYASPSVLINGVDVMGDDDGAAACRLALPTVDLLRDALRRATEQTTPVL